MMRKEEEAVANQTRSLDFFLLFEVITLLLLFCLVGALLPF